VIDVNLQFIDTHAHIHFPDYGLNPDDVWSSAQNQGVAGMLVVGCRLNDSEGAVDFARKHERVWASIGIHPHEAEDFEAKLEGRQRFEAILTDPRPTKIVAIGEIGLDYFYSHSNKDSQKELLKWQLELAEKYNLPVIFHVRDAFEEFWPIFDSYSIKRAIIHSFTGVLSDVEQILKRDLYIGLNGIMTFTKDVKQLEAAKAVPLDRLVLETDAPYLTPKTFRGNICKPEHVKLTAAFMAELRGEPLEQLAEHTTQNAQRLFKIEI